MNTRIKNIILSVVIGIVAWLGVLFVQNQSPMPTGTADYISLLVIISAVIAGSLLAGSGRAGVISATGDEETGTVKWFNIKKGYGFITRDQGDDVFVHYRNIQGGQGRKAIAEGQRVRFVVVTGDKGLQAEEVEAL